MRLVGSRASELENDTDGEGITATATDRTSSSSAPPVPAITGIAAWDSALLQEYRRRQRAEKQRAADEAAAAAAAEREGDEWFECSGEDTSTAAVVWRSNGRGAVVAPAFSTPTGERRCQYGANGRGRAAETSVAATLPPPAVASATTATATAPAIATATATTIAAPAIAAATLSHNAATACEKLSKASDENTAGESTEDSTCTDDSTTDSGSTSDDSGDYDHDSAYGDGQAGHRLHRPRSLDMQEHGVERVQGDGKHRQHSPKTDERQVVADMPGDSGVGEQDSQNHQDTDHETRDLSEIQERQRAENLGEREPAREEIVRSQRTGAPNIPRLPRRRRKRKLRGYELALELATRCLRKDGFNAKAYCLRAELEARLGRRDRTMADYGAAASLEVGDPRPRINMVCEHPLALCSLFRLLLQNKPTFSTMGT